jgi:hypothetical protein
MSNPAPSDPLGSAALDLPGDEAQNAALPVVRPVEIGGRGGLDPTRYGDWEKNGRCIDF